MVKRAGFTLIELMVVLAIIATLLTIAAPRYLGSLDRSKEAVLKEDLFQVRDAIAKYHGDKGRYPESLETLAAERYLRKVPVDPLTDSSLTWLTVAPVEPEQSGVYDLRSGAPGRASDGTAYADW
ncbi:MAG TPA: prepilin-type N-terminal cleavage/methylation domain-containing protein [Burkholderiales bacterium]